jgi:hypothetical protein
MSIALVWARPKVPEFPVLNPAAGAGYSSLWRPRFYRLSRLLPGDGGVRVLGLDWADRRSLYMSHQV